MVLMLLDKKDGVWAQFQLSLHTWVVSQKHITNHNNNETNLLRCLIFLFATLVSPYKSNVILVQSMRHKESFLDW